jgi:PPOX class probable F420-dependent enzyme
VNDLNLPNWVRGLIEESRVAHLGLLDADGEPRVQPVTFAPVGDDVWSAVDDKPKSRPGHDLARVRRLRRHPRASLTIDRYDDDWSRLAWVQLLGDVSVLDVAPSEAMAALSSRYAPYRERPPGGPFLRLAPERALWWRAGSDPS